MRTALLTVIAASSAVLSLGAWRAPTPEPASATVELRSSVSGHAVRFTVSANSAVTMRDAAGGTRRGTTIVGKTPASIELPDGAIDVRIEVAAGEPDLEIEAPSSAASGIQAMVDNARSKIQPLNGGSRVRIIGPRVRFVSPSSTRP